MQKELEVKENMNKDKYLSSLACKNSMAIRLKEESEDYRPPFYRDIDRIIYSLAYTRYINKTQVFTNSSNDNITKRSTHVQLVSKIGRTIGRALGLNEDLIEAAALGHDIGHTPFGHAGEAILNRISLKVGEGYFNHNVQSFRKLEYLEHRGEGLNLTMQVLDAIICHNGELELDCYRPKKKSFSDLLNEYKKTYTDPEFNKTLIPSTLEGCVVRISDIIAYLGKDIEDAIRLHVLKKEDLPEELLDKIGHKNSEIVNYFVTDIIDNSYGLDYIKMSKEAFNNLVQLKKFNYEYIYKRANSKETLDKWEEMFNVVFDKSLKDLENKDINSHIYIYYYKYMNKEYKNNTTHNRVIIDYIAGMTDRFFVKEYNYAKDGELYEKK